MTDTTSQTTPMENEETITTEGHNEVMPSEVPPTEIEYEGAASEVEAMDNGVGDAVPSMPVPADDAGGLAAWHNNKKITGLWSINQNRNSWVSVSGIGWKKLANNSDSAIVALTMLSSHALEKGSIVNLREDKSMIKEMYVW